MLALLEQYLFTSSSPSGVRIVSSSSQVSKGSFSVTVDGQDVIEAVKMQDTKKQIRSLLESLLYDVRCGKFSSFKNIEIICVRLTIAIILRHLDDRLRTVFGCCFRLFCGWWCWRPEVWNKLDGINIECRKR